MSRLPPQGAASAAWDDDILSDRPTPGLTPEAAHLLLEMNPSLRAHGADTNIVVDQAAKARSAGKCLRSGPQPVVRDADHLFERATLRFAQEKRQLEAELSMVQAKLLRLRERHLTELIDKLAELDGNLGSVVTQAAMKTHKSLLDTLGFSPKRFIDRLRGRL